MARRSSPPALALAIALLAGAGGCYHYETMRVEVRAAATGLPVSGAIVHAWSINAEGPTSIRTLAGIPSMPDEGRATTGPDGAADLRLAIEDPIQVRILAPGLAPA